MTKTNKTRYRSRKIWFEVWTVRNGARDWSVLALSTTGSTQVSILDISIIFRISFLLSCYRPDIRPDRRPFLVSIYLPAIRSDIRPFLISCYRPNIWPHFRYSAGYQSSHLVPRRLAFWISVSYSEYLFLYPVTGQIFGHMFCIRPDIRSFLISCSRPDIRKYVRLPVKYSARCWAFGRISGLFL